MSDVKLLPGMEAPREMPSVVDLVAARDAQWAAEVERLEALLKHGAYKVEALRKALESAVRLRAALREVRLLIGACQYAPGEPVPRSRTVPGHVLDGILCDCTSCGPAFVIDAALEGAR